MADLFELQKVLERAATSIPEDTLTVIEAEGLEFISDNFEKQGFQTGTGVEKWPERKTVDTRGRDITRYRSNRRGRAGGLTKFGRRNKGRAILTGHGTGGNKLRNSIEAFRDGKAVTFLTYKEYAQRHNEGLDGMPERKFIGLSPEWDGRITKRLKPLLDQKFKR